MTQARHLPTREECTLRLRPLLESLELPYKSLDLYILAFVHKSVLNEGSRVFQTSNERLEFLGDAVLELTITTLLYHQFPNKQEGEMTDIRSALVRGKNLAVLASKLHFDEFVLVSRGEAAMGGRQNPYILANCFESFIGAIFLDAGFTAAFKFIRLHVYGMLDEILQKNLHIDPKTALQEWSQAHYGVTPEYLLLEESGADHNKIYTVQVQISDKKYGQGTGTSKKKAEQAAAESTWGLIHSQESQD